jgi:hypothetical protein
LIDFIIRVSNFDLANSQQIEDDEDSNALERKGSKVRLVIAPPAPTRNAAADLERREQKRAELREIMRSQASARAADTTQILIFEGKKPQE